MFLLRASGDFLLLFGSVSGVSQRRFEGVMTHAAMHRPQFCAKIMKRNETATRWCVFLSKR